jgi:predicted nicotinamide N-methyase
MNTRLHLITIALHMLICRCYGLSANVNAAKTVIPLRVQDENVKPQKKKMEGKIPVRSRIVPIDTKEVDTITIWELEEPSKLMEMWWSADLDPSAAVKKEKIGDPFGVIMWPGSILASKELVQHRAQIANSTVLVLGAGTGVEAQCAALLGASKVIAIDISKLTLKLLRFGAEQAGVGDVVEPMQFDLFSKEPLPACDVMVAADVLYNEELAHQIGKRVVEVLRRDCPPAILITDSQRFHGTDFLQDVNEVFPDRLPLEWEYFELQNVRGSGVMIAEDQTYDATTRMVSTGWGLDTLTNNKRL